MPLKGWRATEKCNWCDLLHTTPAVVLQAPTFRVLGPDEDRGRRHLTVVTSSHVSVLTELPEEEMAAVLAGLSRVVHSIKRAYQLEEVQILADSLPLSESGRHLHFDLIPKAVKKGETEGATALIPPPRP